MTGGKHYDKSLLPMHPQLIPPVGCSSPPPPEAETCWRQFWSGFPLKNVFKLNLKKLTYCKGQQPSIVLKQRKQPQTLLVLAQTNNPDIVHDLLRLAKTKKCLGNLLPWEGFSCCCCVVEVLDLMPLTITSKTLHAEKKNRNSDQNDYPITQCKQQKRMKTPLAQLDTVPNKSTIKAHVVKHKFSIPNRILHLHSLAHGLQNQNFFLLLSKRIPKQTQICFIMRIPYLTCAAVNAKDGFDLSHAICKLQKSKKDPLKESVQTPNHFFTMWFINLKPNSLRHSWQTNRESDFPLDLSPAVSLYPVTLEVWLHLRC